MAARPDDDRHDGRLGLDAPARGPQGFLGILGTPVPGVGHSSDDRRHHRVQPAHLHTADMLACLRSCESLPTIASRVHIFYFKASNDLRWPRAMSHQSGLPCPKFVLARCHINLAYPCPKFVLARCHIKLACSFHNFSRLILWFHFEQAQSAHCTHNK